MYNRERPLRETATTTIPHRRKTPSFSSSLLDAIYRSIDEPSPTDPDSVFCTDKADPAMIKKQSTCSVFDEKQGRRRLSSSLPSRMLMRDDSLIEEWMEKQTTQKNRNSSLNFASISTSSAASSSGVDRETERSRRFHKSRPELHDFGKKKVRQQVDDEGRFTKTKLRALKIYSELKSLKQPISPGARITGFLNALFNSGNVKKAKMCYVGAADDVSFERKSKSKAQTPATSVSSSSSSSSSSSLLGRNKVKRSVRFYPVGVIVGEDSRPCGHKPIYEHDRRYRDVVSKKNSSSSSSSVVIDRGFNFRARFEEYEEEEEEEDAESCASSDLFELDHLIGIGRYREELPLYETTCLKKNHAIAIAMKL